MTTATRPQLAVRPQIAVGGVAFDSEGRVLLVQRGRPPGEGLWTLPGGRLELGELLRDAVVREVQEETGLVASVGELVELVERVIRDDAGDISYHYVIADFLVVITAGLLRPGDDARDARWCDDRAVRELPLTAGLLPVLARAKRMR